MGYFSQAFTDIARGPSGEALRVRLHVRLNDGVDGSPGTLLTITEGQELLNVSQIERKRERSFGVIQGQAWQVQATNKDLAMLAYSLPGCWACIEGGFPVADEWAVFAQGKINSFVASTNGTVTLEVRDAVMDVLKFKLPRDMRFCEEGWLSSVKTVRQDKDSVGWDDEIELYCYDTWGLLNLIDETFCVVFTTTTTFEVRSENEDGAVLGSGSISAECQVASTSGESDAFRIPAAGWSAESGAYEVGDTYEIFTSEPRTTAELTPVNMVRHLIEDVAGLTCYNVLDGAFYSSPLFDETNWDDLVDLSPVVAGSWSKGSSLSSLIQGALTVVHGTVYPAPSGQVALWVLQPASGESLVLNGDPGSGQVDILTGQYTDTLADTITDCLFKYLILGSGEDASYAATIPLTESPLLERRAITVKIGWEVRGISVMSAANTYLARNKEAKREHYLKCTLAGAVAELGGTVGIREATTGLNMAVVSTTGINIDLLRNKADVKAHNDPFVNQGFFVIGESLIGGSDVLW